MMLRFLWIVLLGILPLLGCARNISPLDYGLLSAKSDIERYEVLLETHRRAMEKGYGVTYKGISQINVEIPARGATSIPLPHYTDFAGVMIVVRNQVKTIPLFSFSQELKEIQLSKEQLASGNYRDAKELNKGRKLLVIIDQLNWVERRAGHSNGATRKDILLLKRGRALNNVIASYGDDESQLKFYWCNVPPKKIVVKNLIFERTADSNAITTLFTISNADNVLIKRIVVNTPKGTGLYGETALKFENCTNLKVEDVTINGTYSLRDKYGYGIGMNNVWKSSFVRLKANGDWGIFGNNNVNFSQYDQCDINRVDIHCYGKDVFCRNSTFRDLYNQFSSLYGTLSYENCHFVNFVPVLFESSYSAYTQFKLIIKDCIIEVASDRPYLISAGNPAKLSENPRRELSKASWPDIEIRNLRVLLPVNAKSWTLFQLKGGGGTDIFGISDIAVEGLEIVGGNLPKVVLSNSKMRYQRKPSIRLSKSNIDRIEE